MAFRISIIFSFLFFSCNDRSNSVGDSSVKETADQINIKDFLLRYYDEMSKRDWKKFRTYFWDSATITTIWQRPGDSTEAVHIITIDEFIRETPNGPDSRPIFEERMTGSEIKVVGDLASAWANYYAKFGTKDSLMEWKGRDQFSLMRHRGQWKIVSLSFERE